MQTGSSALVGGERNGLSAAVRATRLIFLVSGIGMAAWAPMVPYAKARLGLLDEASLGLLLLAFGGGSMVSMPLVGFLTHRFGSRRVIGVGGLMLCLALPLLAIAPSVATLALGLVYFGVALGAVDVAMNAHAVEVERRDGRSPAQHVTRRFDRHGDHAGLRRPAQRPGADRFPGPGQWLAVALAAVAGLLLLTAASAGLAKA